MRPSLCEGKPRAGDEVAHGAGDEHFARGRDGSDPRADRDGDPGELSVEALALSCVDAGSDLHAELPQVGAHGKGAFNRAAWAVKRREEAVAGRVELFAAELGKPAAHDSVVSREQIAPGAVAERG